MHRCCRSPGQPAAPAAATIADNLLEALNEYVDVHAPQINARIAVAEQRPSDAIAALVGAPMPRDAATVELIAALKQALPSKDAGIVPDVAAIQQSATRPPRRWCRR